MSYLLEHILFDTMDDEGKTKLKTETSCGSFMMINCLRLCFLLLPFVAGFIQTNNKRLPSLEMRKRTNINLYSFERRNNIISFGDKFDVSHNLGGSLATLVLFFQDPKHIMTATWPENQLLALGPDGDFRLFQEPINFAGLVEFEFFVDVHVDVLDNGSSGIQIWSKEMVTTASFNGRKRTVPVQLDLRGELKPTVSSVSREASILGWVKFDVSGPLTGPLLFCPDFALRTAAFAVNKSVLNYARRSFMQGLSRNFNSFSHAKP